MLIYILYIGTRDARVKDNNGNKKEVRKGTGSAVKGS